MILVSIEMEFSSFYCPSHPSFFKGDPASFKEDVLQSSVSNLVDTVKKKTKEDRGESRL